MTDWVTLRDQLNLVIRPIEHWPGKFTNGRERGPFSASSKDTLRILRTGLCALHARSIVLEAAFPPSKIRQDGLPYANATAEHPGIVLTFQSDKGPLRIWFDRFTKWENNLRAIAFHLQHLRHATLYGVGEDGQVYRGWTALPAAPDRATMAESEAASVIARHSSRRSELEVLTSATVFLEVAKEARRATHPDVGGSVETFKTVETAIAVLKKRFNL